MKDYQKYINALRKCAKEHENDRTSTGHIIVSDLCRDTANLLEALNQEPKAGRCKWIKYDYRTICPSEHDIDNPYWRIPEKRMDVLKYCPYCGKEIEVTE